MADSAPNTIAPSPGIAPGIALGIALVTGAARRIGRTVAVALARQGWDIVVHYGKSVSDANETAEAIRAVGRRAALISADLGVVSEVDTLFERSEALLGPIRCVVNNASKFEFDSVDGFDHAALDDQMHVNVAAPVTLARALAHSARLAPGAHPAVVINMLDQKLFNLNPDFFSYTLSKAALHAATTMLAQALAPDVRVVGIAPGLTLVSGDQAPEDFERAHQQTPLGYSSRPDDIAQAICYAVTAHAVTGTTLLVDGGQHLIPTVRDVMFLAKAPA